MNSRPKLVSSNISKGDFQVVFEHDFIGCQFWVFGCGLSVVGFHYFSSLHVLYSSLRGFNTKLNGYQIISNPKPASSRDGFDLAESCIHS